MKSLVSHRSTGSNSSASFLNIKHIERHYLANGLKVILIPDHSAPVVAFQTWFNVGSRFERPGLTGIAHLFEHLMFKETSSLPEGAFSRVLEEVGARDLNAATSFDYTVYTQSVPRHRLELVMQLESDRMVNLVLNDRQLTSEREVVMNERRFCCEDDPYGRLNEALFELAFDIHPYRYPIIGSMHDIARISLDDCLTFYRSYYAPNNAVIIIAGDFKTTETLTLLERYYGALPAQPITIPETPAEPPLSSPRVREMILPIESDILLMGLRVPPLVHPDRPALELLDILLAQGKTSRLERNLIDTGIASSVSSVLLPGVDTTLYEIEVNLREGRRAEEARAIIFDNLKSLAAGDIAEAELQRALQRCRVGIYQELYDNSDRANFVGTLELVAGSFEQGFNYVRDLEQVTRADIQRAACQWLSPDSAVVILGRPAEVEEKPFDHEGHDECDDPDCHDHECDDPDCHDHECDDPDCEDSDFRQDADADSSESDLQTGLDSSSSRTVNLNSRTGSNDDSSKPDRWEDLPDEQLFDERTVELPASRSAESPALPAWLDLAETLSLVPSSPWKLETIHRGSSLNFRVLEDHALPLVSFKIRIPGGRLLEPKRLEGLAEVTCETMLRGTQKHTRRHFEDQLDLLGASISISSRLDHLSIGGLVLRDSLDSYLGLLEQALQHPSFHPDEFDQVRSEAVASVLESRNDDKTLAEFWHFRFLYPEHVLGRSTGGTTHSLEQIRLEDVRQQFQVQMAMNRAEVGVAGAISPEEAIAKLEPLIRSLPSRSGPDERLPIAKTQPGRHVFLIDKPDRTQTQILIGHGAIPASHPDYPALSMGTTAFGGAGFTTRLMQEVREKRGWSYGASARLDANRDGGSFTIWVFPAMRDAILCLKLVLEQLELVADRGITSSELEYARRFALNGAAFDEDTPERCVRSAMDLSWLGINRRDLLERVAAMSLEDVNQAIRQHYDTANLTITMVCTAEELLEPLQTIPDIEDVSIVPYNAA